MKYVSVLFACVCEVVCFGVLFEDDLLTYLINHCKHIGIMGSVNGYVVVMLCYCWRYVSM